MCFPPFLHKKNGCFWKVDRANLKGFHQSEVTALVTLTVDIVM